MHLASKSSWRDLADTCFFPLWGFKTTHSKRKWHQPLTVFTCAAWLSVSNASWRGLCCGRCREFCCITVVILKNKKIKCEITGRKEELKYLIALLMVLFCHYSECHVATTKASRWKFCFISVLVWVKGKSRVKLAGVTISDYNFDTACGRKLTTSSSWGKPFE